MYKTGYNSTVQVYKTGYNSTVYVYRTSYKSTVQMNRTSYYSTVQEQGTGISHQVGHGAVGAAGGGVTEVDAEAQLSLGEVRREVTQRGHVLQAGVYILQQNEMKTQRIIESF